MEKIDDDEVDDEEVSQKCSRSCIQLNGPNHACKQKDPHACRRAPSFFIFIVPLQGFKSGNEGLEVRVNHGSGGGGVRGGVGNKAGLRLLLVLLPFLVKLAVGREMHTPCHVVHTPMLSVFAHFLAHLFTILGWYLLPLLILLMLGLVPVLLLVLHLGVALFLALASLFQGIPKLLVGLEMSLESLDFSGHCRDLLVVKRFGAPNSLHLKPVILTRGRDHQGLVSEVSESFVKVVFILATNVLLDVVCRGQCCRPQIGCQWGHQVWRLGQLAVSNYC
jgi:hypothetical protein